MRNLVNLAGPAAGLGLLFAGSAQAADENPDQSEVIATQAKQMPVEQINSPSSQKQSLAVSAYAEEPVLLDNFSAGIGGSFQSWQGSRGNVTEYHPDITAALNVSIGENWFFSGNVDLTTRKSFTESVSNIGDQTKNSRFALEANPRYPFYIQIRPGQDPLRQDVIQIPEAVFGRAFNVGGHNATVKIGIFKPDDRMSSAAILPGNLEDSLPVALISSKPAGMSVSYDVYNRTNFSLGLRAMAGQVLTSDIGPYDFRLLGGGLYVHSGRDDNDPSYRAFSESADRTLLGQVYGVEAKAKYQVTPNLEFKAMVASREGNGATNYKPYKVPLVAGANFEYRKSIGATNIITAGGVALEKAHHDYFGLVSNPKILTAAFTAEVSRGRWSLSAQLADTRLSGTRIGMDGHVQMSEIRLTRKISEHLDLSASFTTRNTTTPHNFSMQEKGTFLQLSQPEFNAGGVTALVHF